MIQWWDKRFIGMTNNQQKYNLSFEKTSLRLAINYLLGNCYITLGGSLQLIGIPMGFDLVSFKFVLHYEIKWLFQRKRDQQKASIFSNILGL